MSIFIHNGIVKKIETTQLIKLGVFTTSEALEAGFSQPSLSRLASTGEIIRLQHGIFHHKDADLDIERLDFILATKRFGPNAIVGLMSALFYHRLTEQVPKKIWLLVPPSVKSNSPLYKCIRVRTDLKIGVERHKHFAITNIERTVVEAFKYSTKVGLDVAVRAAKTALKQRQTTAQKILRQAKELRMEKLILRHWEAITID